MATATEHILDGSILGEQIESEEAAIQLGVARYRRLAQEAVERGEGAGLKPAERMIVHWFEPLVWKIRGEIRSIKAGKPGQGRGLYGPVIQCLDADRLAFITIHTALSRCMAEPNGDLIPRLAYALGSAVVAEIHMDLMRKDPDAKLKDLDRKFKKLNTQRVNWWAKRTLNENLWNRKVCVHLGTRLMWCLIETASSRPYDEPFHLAFHHEKQWRDNQKKGVLRMDDEVFAAIEQGHGFRQGLRPRYKPMIVPPYKWTSNEAGGFIRVRTPLVSKPTPEQEEAIMHADMDEYYEGLNAVNAQPWQVNERILAVIEKIWDQGGNDAGVPGRSNRPMPQKPLGIEDDKEVLKTWKRKAHEVHSHNAALKGERVEFLHKIYLARDLVGKDFWIPHQACFRSRVYPVPLYLHPQSDDVARGLLLFGGDPKPLTTKGRYWLYVQAANMFGFDKASLNDRVEWSLSKLEQFESWARHPFHDQGWMEADEPLQFLATCMALSFDEIGERMPVQEDGSLNGLQHMAALARCRKAGKLVNLLPSTKDERPEDGYLEVADAVKVRLDQDTERGIPTALTVGPLMQNEKNRRNICKRPVMTKTYNCTKVGARDQVKDELKKMKMPREQIYPASKYLSQLILDSLADRLGGANDLFNWLVETARALVKDSPGQSLDWITPLGFHVVQPYRQWGKCEVKTCLQRITLAYRIETADVHTAKQIQGIVANFIHSLDASHLLRCATAFERQHIAFGCVHDSIWTHANDIDEAHEIIRAEFVALHEEPILDDLVKRWRKSRPEAEIQDPPAMGHLDLNEVMESTYFFS